MNAQDKEGRTALAHAAINQQVAALQKLVDSGGDLAAVDGGGRTPLMHAARSEDPGLIQVHHPDHPPPPPALHLLPLFGCQGNGGGGGGLGFGLGGRS